MWRKGRPSCRRGPGGARRGGRKLALLRFGKVVHATPERLLRIEQEPTGPIDEERALALFREARAPSAMTRLEEPLEAVLSYVQSLGAMTERETTFATKLAQIASTVIAIATAAPRTRRRSPVDGRVGALARPVLTGPDFDDPARANAQGVEIKPGRPGDELVTRLAAIAEDALDTLVREVTKGLDRPASHLFRVTLDAVAQKAISPRFAAKEAPARVRSPSSRCAPRVQPRLPTMVEVVAATAGPLDAQPVGVYATRVRSTRDRGLDDGVWLCGRARAAPGWKAGEITTGMPSLASRRMPRSRRA